MGARYPFYVLADSRDGQIKEAAIKGLRQAPSRFKETSASDSSMTERQCHLRSIANNAEIDVIWEKWQMKLDLCANL